MGCDEGILITGDLDLSTAVKFVKQKGKYVKIASFRNSLSHELEKLADECIILDAIADQIVLKKEGPAVI